MRFAGSLASMWASRQGAMQRALEISASLRGPFQSRDKSHRANRHRRANNLGDLHQFPSLRPENVQLFFHFKVCSQLGSPGIPLDVETDDAIFILSFHGFLLEIEIADVDIERDRK